MKVNFIVTAVFLNLFPLLCYSVITEDVPRILFEIAKPYLRIDRLQVAKPEKCIPDLGCFSNDGLFYHPVYRPLSLIPEDRDVIGTKFILFTRRNPHTPQNITANVDVIKQSNFNPRTKTIIIVHGFYFDNFFGEYQLDAFRSLRQALFALYEINLIFVDWGRGASTWYLQATANSRVVGAEVALLVNSLIDHHKLSGKDFHIIGHSLGSHIAGYAGERIKNLGRITGLDPAKPYFDNMPLKVKLDPTDADFVDVIHTNAPMLAHPFGFGTRELSGDIDYYPNDGNGQPGCIQEKKEAFLRMNLASGLRESGICNHARSIAFLTETLINRKCKMFSFRCPSYELFESGQCWRCGPKKENCRIMGEYYPTNGVKYANLEGYYLKTHSSSPFCAFQFRVEVRINFVPKSIENCLVSLAGEAIDGRVTASGNSRRILINKKGQIVSFILMGPDEILTVKRIKLTWVRAVDNVLARVTNNLAEPTFNSSLSIDYVKVTPMNLWDDHLKDKLTVFGCAATIYNNRYTTVDLNKKKSC